MAKHSDDTDPRFMVEIGSERFDPKGKAADARRQVAAGKKKLAKALGIRAGEIPGADRAAYLVQFEDDLEAETVRRFRDVYGIHLKQGISSLAFIERMDRGTAAKVRTDSAVRAIIPYSPDLKPQLGDRAADVPSVRFEIGLIDGDDLDAVRSILQTLGLTILSVNDDTKSGGSLSLLAEAALNADVVSVAAVDDVAWVARIGDLAIKNLDTAGVAQSGDGANRPVWRKGLRGKGMIIGVIDDGELDLRSKFLRDSGHAAAGAGHRKVVDNRKAVGVNPPLVPAHPTLVSGAAIGDEEGNEGNHPNRGGAWEAKIAYGDMNRFNGVSPSGSLLDEFNAAAGAGARVHTNSWGFTVPGAAAPAYDSAAADIDGFLWVNERHLCLIAAPNPGGPFEKALVVAKNPIEVGGVGAWPNQNVRQADPGPLTADNRRKPDLLGVSEAITTSTLTNSGANVLAVATFNGNSLTTPHIAAAAALAREYFCEGWYPNGKREAKNGFTPSGSLLKAVLLNATVPLTGQQYPNGRDGWGRLQLNRTLHFDGDKLLLRVWDVPHLAGLNGNGKTDVFPLAVPANVKSLKVTLVFNDPKGAVGAADPVVNKLDLELTEPIPRRFGYFGNDFVNNRTRRRDLTAAGLNIPPNPNDLKNNVRQILVDTPTSGRWAIVVRAHQIDQANTPISLPFFRRSQGYALVVCVERN